MKAFAICGTAIFAASLFVNTANAGFLDDLTNQIKKGVEDVQGIVNPKAEPKKTVQPPPPQPRSTTNGARYDKPWIIEIQRHLAVMGFDSGPVDGAFGKATESSIKAFERSRGMTVTGLPTPSVMEALRSRTQANTQTDNSVAGTQPQGNQQSGGNPSTQTAASAGSKVAPAPGGGMVAPSPGGGIVAPAPPATAPSSAQGRVAASGEQQTGGAKLPGSGDYAALAKKHGLTLVRGLPLIGRENFSHTKEQMAAVSKFLDFVALGLDPSYIERNPLCWVHTHISSSEKQEYIVQGTAALSSSGKNSLPPGQGGLIAWKGADEFARERTKKAFFARHAEVLKAKAVSMPLQLIVVDEMRLPPYDRNSGGFNLGLNKDLASPNEGLSFGRLYSYRGVQIPGAACSRSGFHFSPPAATVPDVWAVDASEAENVLGKAIERKVYIGIAFNFRTMPQAGMPAREQGTTPNQASNRMPVWSELISIGVYEDPDLERLIATLPLVNARPPVLLTGVPDAPPVPESVNMNDSELAFLLLRDHKDALGPEAWQRLLRRQLKQDELYYARRRHFETGDELPYQSPSKTFDKAYVPFFPNGFKPTYTGQFPTEEMAAQFKQWASKRAVLLPRKVVFRTIVTKNGRATAKVFLPIIDRKDQAPLAGALQGRGHSVNQVLWLDPNPHGLSKFDHELLSGAGKSRRPALLLPNIVSSYLIPDDEIQKLYQPAKGENAVEIVINSSKSELVPVNNPDSRSKASELFLLHGLPAQIKIWDRDRRKLLFEKTYDVATLNPNRLDSEAPTISVPKGDFLPLSAEAVDLLVVKYLRQALSDEDYRQMMLARWEYEASIPPTRAIPDWGRFFIPGKSKPNDNQQAAILKRFKDWTANRANALPGKIRLHYRLVRYNDGNPVSAEAPWSQSDAGQYQRSIRQTLNSCNTEESSYPAIAPACAYLENVAKNTPEIHPFGYGVKLAGPRVICATVLDNGSDPYCNARKVQFKKGKKIDPGFHDVFVFDKEIFIPGSRSDLKTLSSNGNMTVDVRIAGLRLADKSLPRPFDEATKRYGAYREGLGLRVNRSTGNQREESGRYFIFDAQVLGARLVRNKSHEPIADLELRAARNPGLDVLKAPAPTTSSPGRPFGPDIVGLRLGMTFDEADRIIRSHMKVGHVLTRDRAKDPTAITGEFERFSSSKLYISQGLNEFIILYDEPPSAPRTVLGITRQLTFPNGQLIPLQVLSQLRKKYGKEDWTGRRKGVGWGNGLRQTTIEDSVAHKCLPDSVNRSLNSWVEDGASGTPSNPSNKGLISKIVPNMNMYQEPIGRNCGAVLGMEISIEKNPMQEDRLILQLTDANLYWKNFKESKRLIKSGGAGFGAEAKGPKIKF